MPLSDICSGISFRYDDSIFVALAEPCERNEAAIQSQSQNQKIEEIQREIFNVKTELIELNKMTRYSFFLFGIVILLLSPSAFISAGLVFTMIAK